MNKKPQTRNNKPTNTELHYAEQHVSGPLPSAKEMEGYQAIDPELVRKIVAMAENETAHRHQQEAQTMQANINIAQQQFIERKRGQTFGLIISLAAFSASVLLGWLGAETAAAIVGGSTAVGLAGIFVTGRILTKK